MAIKLALSHASDSAPDAMSRYLFVVDRMKALRYCKRSAQDTDWILDTVELCYRYLDGLETEESYKQKAQDYLGRMERKLRSKENA